MLHNNMFYIRIHYDPRGYKKIKNKSLLLRSEKKNNTIV